MAIGDPILRKGAVKLKLEDIDSEEALKIRNALRADDLYSEDYGLFWTDLGVIASSYINSMVYLSNGIVILGDNSGHVYRSTDYGLTWTDLGDITSTNNNAMTYLGNGIVILGDALHHVYRSTDYGATWTDLGAVAPGTINTMTYLGNGIVALGDVTCHVCRSTDYGLTWTDLGEIPNSGSFDEICTMTYLGNGIVTIGEYYAHVCRSTDYGLTWTDLGQIASSYIFSMAYLGHGIVVFGTGHVYRSTDYGATWTDLGAVASDSIYAMTYLGNGIVVLGAYNHVCRSTDYGATWTDLGAITTNWINAMTYLGNGIVILGDSAYHVYRSTSAFGNANFNPNQFDKLFQFGCLGAITPNGTSYLAPGNGATQANEIKIRVPRPGILKNLHIWQRVASGADGRTDIYTVRVNGADKTITCTLDNATTGADTTHEVLVAQGDQISTKLVSNDASDASADVVATLELM